MLIEDRTMPFLGMAWDPSKMAEFFTQHVLPSVGPGQQVQAVVIEDMTYIPEKQCDILYSLQFNHSAQDHCEWAVVTFAKASRLEKTYIEHYGDVGQASRLPATERQAGRLSYEIALGKTSNRAITDIGQSASPKPARAVFLPEYGCLVEFFPTDWKLPYLARAMDGEQMAVLLSRLGAAADRAASGWQPEAKVLQYRPHHRCVLRYVMGSAEGQGSEDVIDALTRPFANRRLPAIGFGGLRVQKLAAATDEFVEFPLFFRGFR